MPEAAYTPRLLLLEPIELLYKMTCNRESAGKTLRNAGGALATVGLRDASRLALGQWEVQPGRGRGWGSPQSLESVCAGEAGTAGKREGTFKLAIFNCQEDAVRSSDAPCPGGVSRFPSTRLPGEARPAHPRDPDPTTENENSRCRPPLQGAFRGPDRPLLFNYQSCRRDALRGFCPLQPALGATALPEAGGSEHSAARALDSGQAGGPGALHSRSRARSPRSGQDPGCRGRDSWPGDGWTCGCFACDTRHGAFSEWEPPPSCTHTL